MHTLYHCAARTARRVVTITAGTCLAACLLFTESSSAQTTNRKIGAVFYIELENRNWTQPASDSTAPHQIFGSPAAPYLNSLVTPGDPNSVQVSYCTAYHHVLARPNGAIQSIHPSEPNYLWQEAGTNFGILNDNDPYASNSGSVGVIKTYLINNPAMR